MTFSKVLLVLLLAAPLGAQVFDSHNAYKIRSKNVCTTAPTVGQLLQFDGTNWCPVTGAGGGDTITSPNSSLTIGGTSSATTLDVSLLYLNGFYPQLNPTTSNTFTAGKPNITQASATTAGERSVGAANPSSPVAGDRNTTLLGTRDFYDGANWRYPLTSTTENPGTSGQMPYINGTTPTTYATDPQFLRSVPAANKVQYDHLAGSAQTAAGDKLECWSDATPTKRFCIGLDNSGDPVSIWFGDPATNGTIGFVTVGASSIGAQTSIGGSANFYLHNLRGAGGTPALSACGGGTPAISGSDLGGTVTEGTTATGCTITFVTAYAVAPHCVITSEAGLGFTYTLSTSAITITNVGALSSTKIDYMCMSL